MKFSQNLLLVLCFFLIGTANLDAQAKKKKKATTTTKKKAESEYVPDDYQPDDYKPDDIPESNSLSGPKKAGTSSQKPGRVVISEYPTDTLRKPDADAPLDDIIKRDMIVKKLVLPYEPIHERDIFWERRIWRVIDCREKLNRPFKYPEEELFSILKKGIEEGIIRSYTSDKFEFRQTTEEINSRLSKIDTATVVDPETGAVSYKPVKDDIDVQSINQYRVKETWFFDSESSVMKVRILGIAPMIVEVDPVTGLEFPPVPLFWIYYPDARKYLSEHRVFNEDNIAVPISWEDLFEMRKFSSYITMRSNVNKYRSEERRVGK